MRPFRTMLGGLLLLPFASQAQYDGGIGRGDAQYSFVPTGVGIRPIPGGTATLRAWPVPTQGILRLDQVVTATIHDVEGRLVGSVARASTVDVTGLAAGVYTLRTERGVILRFTRE